MMLEHLSPSQPFDKGTYVFEFAARNRWLDKCQTRLASSIRHITKISWEKPAKMIRVETLWLVTSIILVNDWFIKFYRKIKRGFLRCETKNPASTHESANDNKLWLLPSEEFQDLICPPLRWHSPSVSFKSLVCLDHWHVVHHRLSHPKVVNFRFSSIKLKKFGSDGILCAVVFSAARLYPR